MQVTNSKTVIEYPVTLQEAKNQLNLCDATIDEDTLIQDYIKAATMEAEHVIQKDIAQTRNVAKIWDWSQQSGIIDEGNFANIEGIISPSDSSISWNEDDTRGRHEDFILTLNNSISADPLTVTFITGWPAEDVDEILKLAIKIKITDYNDMERSSYIPNMRNNDAFVRLLSFYTPAL